MIVDLFAGGGGASTGIYFATGRHPDAAIDHSRAAVAMHAANHPTTRHLCEDVFDVEPRVVVGHRRVDLLWASPDCTHHNSVCPHVAAAAAVVRAQLGARGAA